MNVLPAVGFGLLFLYVAKSNKTEKRKALKESENVYRYGDLPDIIGDISVGERFTVELPSLYPEDGNWILKATPPKNEVSLIDTEEGQYLRYIFKGKKKGAGSIVFHRVISDDEKPLEIVEVNVEVI